MRKNGVFVVLTLAFVITFSAIGDALLVDLPVEPLYSPPVTSLSLADAARRNDYASFDALYSAALNSGRDVSQYADLHRLWKWSMTDPVGGFYGKEIHAQFARAYPGYAAFIEDFKIVDANGNAFYPTSETRAFLLRNAVDDRRPRLSPVIAETKPVEAKPIAAAKPVVAKRTGEAPVLHKKSIEPPPVPVVATTIPVAPPSTINRQPSTRPSPIVAVQKAPAKAGAPSKAAPARPGVGRGIFLIIVGLVGLGVVSVMLHAPADDRTVPHA